MVQVGASAALLWGVVYLVWRIGWSGSGASPGLFVALLAAEIFGWVSLAFYAFLAWSVALGPRPELPSLLPTVDVFVCTYDEAPRIVESTLIGCRAIAVPHRTYLLDDGRRPAMRELAEHLDATYVTRADSSHAKAGNINHALGETHGELILMLDADHVPRPDILDATIGYFTDPHVALVQTPHDFSNRDSVQHTKFARHEQSLFYDVIAPGKDRQNAMFWCGSATLVRRVALVEVGGVLTDTVAEDFHTTIAMHARQWKTRYHPETLVQGLAPHDLAAFLLQRARWARGNLAVFRTAQNPLTCRGLSVGQRASYFASLFNYFASLQRLALLLVLTITLVSGWLPMHASAVTLTALWLPWCVLAFSATIALGRGTLGPLDSTRYGLMTMGINLRGVLALGSRKAGAFKVTPKEGIDDGGVKVLRMLALVTITGMALGAAVLLRALATAGVLTLPAMDPFVTAVVLVFGTWELGCIAKVLVPLVRRHQLRTRFRTAVTMQARVESTAVRVEILDLNTDGLSFASGVSFAPAERLNLLTRVPDHTGRLADLALPVEVRSSAPGEDGRFRIGCRILEQDVSAHERLVEFCDVVLPMPLPGGANALPVATPARESRAS